MRKIALIIVALVMTVSANAQFEQGKVYVNASMSGLDLSSQAKKFHFGFEATGGYLFMDNLMALAQVGYNHLEDTDDTFTIGAGGRYYIVQNGLYLGATLKFKHLAPGENDFMPGVHVGYAFFLSKTITFEPQLYMDFSTKRFENSNFGLAVGFGIYL